MAFLNVNDFDLLAILFLKKPIVTVTYLFFLGAFSDHGSKRINKIDYPYAEHLHNIYEPNLRVINPSDTLIHLPRAWANQVFEQT